jgi:hypothetical protein
MLTTSTFAAAPSEVDGRFYVTETHLADDGQKYSYTYLCDPTTTDPQMVLEERADKINDTLQKRANAKQLAEGTLVPLTRFELLSRFTVEERVAIRALGNTDPIVFDFMDLMRQSGNVTHANARAGLAYLVSVGAISAERATVIGAE